MPGYGKALAKWHSTAEADSFHRSFHLHTNGAGDFLLAPRAAFAKVYGLYESTEIYMHTDAYAVVQLFAAGYDQMVLAPPHRIYHADHDRSARAGFNEAMTWPEHEAALSSILRNERSYRLNGRSWGLADRSLPIRHLFAV